MAGVHYDVIELLAGQWFCVGASSMLWFAVGFCGRTMGSGGNAIGMVASSFLPKLCFEEFFVDDAGEVQNHQDTPLVCMVVSQRRIRQGICVWTLRISTTSWTSI